MRAASSHFGPNVGIPVKKQLYHGRLTVFSRP
jgi:hypothetical protein